MIIQNNGGIVMFKELKKGANNEVEKSISENWTKMNILELTIKNRTDLNEYDLCIKNKECREDHGFSG